MATHSSVLAWRIPGMGEPGGLPSLGSHRVGHDCSDLAAAAAAIVVIEFIKHIIAQYTFSFIYPCQLYHISCFVFLGCFHC